MAIIKMPVWVCEGLVRVHRVYLCQSVLIRVLGVDLYTLGHL